MESAAQKILISSIKASLIISALFSLQPQAGYCFPAAALANRLKVQISTVGVFVNEPLDSLCAIAKKARIQVIQLHGEETEADIWENPEKHLPHQKIWKAVRVQTSDDIRLADRLPVDALLLDSFVPGSYGGNGQTANWDLIRQTQIQKPFFLAGGLHTENIPQAIPAVHPYGIDLSGGIETDSWKDREKCKPFWKRSGRLMTPFEN